MDCLAMVLAGGKGRKLGVLTRDIPKPILSFGAGCRLIDFTLSNCVHSGISEVGVLVEYMKEEFDSYIGNGKVWSSENEDFNLTLLQPQNSSGIGYSYNGTADAICQNKNYIEERNVDDILVLPGDQIYKMHYGKMISQHKNSGAAVTIAAIEVPLNRASEYDIITSDRNNKIKFYEQNPKYPESNLASMGIYIFNWKILKKYLSICKRSIALRTDFEEDIIPLMLMSGEKMFVYKFENYWKDIDTVYNLWEANMDLLFTTPSVDICNENWDIISADYYQINHYKYDYNIRNSIIAKGCDIYGMVRKSIVSTGAFIGEDSVIIDSVLMPGAIIGNNVIVYKSIIGNGAVIGDYSIIGGDEKRDGAYINAPNKDGVSLIGAGVNIGKKVKIPLNYMVSKNIDGQREREMVDLKIY